MSRIGRLPVPVPAGVEVTLDGQNVSVKGPKGTLQHRVAEPITVARADNGDIEVTRPDDERVSEVAARADPDPGGQHGHRRHRRVMRRSSRSSASATASMAKGPTELEFALGFSHPVKVTAPEGITFAVEARHPVLRPGHRQAAGRRGRGQHPQAAQAGALQGQGREVRGREGPPQGRKGW